MPRRLTAEEKALRDNLAQLKELRRQDRDAAQERARALKAEQRELLKHRAGLVRALARCAKYAEEMAYALRHTEPDPRFDRWQRERAAVNAQKHPLYIVASAEAQASLKCARLAVELFDALHGIVTETVPT